MRRSAILHIGHTKTGTTSIQHWLAGQGAALAELGHAYPASPGKPNHSRLAGVASGRIATHAWEGTWTADGFLADFNAEMAALPAAIHTVVLSSEHLSLWLTRTEHVARLKALLDPHFDRYRVIVYLRRQDEHQLSMVSTMLREGARPAALLGRNPPDYAALLDRWAAVFGRAAVTPRIFGRADLVDGDAVADFAALAGLSSLPRPGPGDVGARNPSLRPEAQEFLARLNALAPPRPDFELDRNRARRYRRLMRELGEGFAGPGRMPGRAEAAALLEACRAGNERVRAAWFPERASLFPDDLSRYPAQPPGPADAEAVLRVAMTLLLSFLDSDGRPADGQAAAPVPVPTKPVTADRAARREQRRARRAEALRSR